MKIRMILTVMCAVMAASCASNRNTAKNLYGDEVNNPLGAVKSDAEYFRAVGKGESYDENIAKKMAVHIAQAQIAEEIKVWFDETNKLYFKQCVQDADKDLATKFEGMSLSVVSQALTGVTVKDTRTYLHPGTKVYTCFVALEMLRAAAGRELIKGVSEMAKDRTDIDAGKFKETMADVERRKINTRPE